MKNKLNLKELKIIETFEDFKKYFLLTRPYIIRQSIEKQEKDIKYFYKKRLLILTKDNYIIELESSPDISKTLWFDDEQDPPILTEQYFINYNNMHLPYRNISDYLKEKERLLSYGCATGKYDYKGIYLLNYNGSIQVNFDFHNLDYSDKKNFLRYLTKQEEEELLKIIKELQNDYVERLQKYYKRYQNKICCCGYWVNR